MSDSRVSHPISRALVEATALLATLEEGLAIIAPYAERWYWCDIVDSSEPREEPDWSRVPDAKREMVRAKWLAAAAVSEVQRTQLWGPQIPFFQSLPYYSVTVIGVA